MSQSKYTIKTGDPILTKASSSTPCKAASTETTVRLEPKRSPEGLIGTPQEQSSVSKLWRSVLGQSVRDLYEGNERCRRDVFVWMVSPDFEVVCDFANVHPRDMLEQLTALSELPAALAKKYGRQLRAKITEDVYVGD